MNFTYRVTSDGKLTYLKVFQSNGNYYEEEYNANGICRERNIKIYIDGDKVYYTMYATQSYENAKYSHSAYKSPSIDIWIAERIAKLQKYHSNLLMKFCRSGSFK